MDMTVFLDPNVDLVKVASLLNELGHAGRLHTTRHWNGETQARIFEAAKGHAPLTLEHFVPSGVAAHTEVIHDGMNTLPLFNHFQKRFCRLEDGTLAGYNHGSTMWATGPGYFVVEAKPEGDDSGEIAIDYRKVPTGNVPSWPPIVGNTVRLAPLVFAGMVDHCRKISEHVCIGRAEKAGKAMNAWFTLVRQDA